MRKLDLILLHAPSIYDFRERPSMHGPISDVIPSTPVFEMYPLGFVSMVGYLEQHGYHARIINLAVKMLRKPHIDIEKLIRKLDAQAFGFDLHWLVHAAGSLDVAELVKKYHPDKPIILGGFSATYYHREIIQHFPQIDYILRGDTTEKPLLDLMESLGKGMQPDEVENLTWRSPEGKKWINPLSFVPENIDDLFTDYGEVLKLVIRHHDLESILPFESFMEYPFTALLTCKGCNYNCKTCGGSKYSYKNFFNRCGAVFKTPEKLVEEMNIVSEYFKAPLFLIGDLRQAGMKWAEETLNLIRRESLDNTITYEIFDAVPEDYMKKLADSSDSWTLEISPETHEDHVRKIMGKPYTTTQMEKTIEKALSLGCEKFDIFFMIGLSGQSSESALGSVEYSKRLYKKMEGNPKIHTFIAPMAPFLDPGSIIFENPREYGFTLFYKSLREHKEALYQPCWKLYLNYFTEWMTRDEIAETTYEAMIRMNELKAQMGVTDHKKADKIIMGLSLARDIMRKIDNIRASTSDEASRSLLYRQLRWEIEEAKKSTGYAKRELRMPGIAGIRVKGVIKYLLRWASLL